ncbi:Ribosomal RNA small subunit methyltransferase D [Acaryochloris thomasi RCC1774]|uniref:Ribosomal RNA small subunit methyltransferase D n=1 Tax=Acaryochloris thomasi RCC1774 TaxID=1764569 RepID=A0A2W1JE20_9CYAN|nr:16S rRNA (guanine(966)-N(2))-methyltransferase RsmD [Acaryochloris thomasi]PZD71958.1 Ribosomal RNA small subunit methyltransferase D [Acaryochloris thomasi RCC1774]
MRIYGNRQIKTLSGRLTRPTTSRVREAVFEIWRGQIAGCCWLDLCCGSGSMGAEALCRGAGLAIGIEQSGRACSVIRENWQLVAKPEQSWQVIRGDVARRLPKLKQTFDRIYFDPPYDSGIYEVVLDAIATQTLLAPNGELCVEHTPAYALPLELKGIIAQRTKTYGNSAVTFYVRR